MSSDKTAVKHDPAAIVARAYVRQPLPTDESNYDRARGAGSYQVLRDSLQLHGSRGAPLHKAHSDHFEATYGHGSATQAIATVDGVFDKLADERGYERKKPEPGLEHLHVPGMYVPRPAGRLKGSQR